MNKRDTRTLEALKNGQYETHTDNETGGVYVCHSYESGMQPVTLACVLPSAYCRDNQKNFNQILK